MPFSPPKVASRPGSKGDSSRPPRWYRECLGTVQERPGDRLVFVFGEHPAFSGLDEIACGRDGDIGTAAKVENAYREAQRIKRQWRADRKAAKAARAADRGLKLAA
jgi:hypothetical protein